MSLLTMVYKGPLLQVGDTQAFTIGRGTQLSGTGASTYFLGQDAAQGRGGDLVLDAVLLLW